MKAFIAVLLTITTLVGCASGDVALNRKGEVLANQITKADNTGTGKAIGNLSGLATADSDVRLAGWIFGGLIGDAIEEGTLSMVSELVIRLEDNRVINIKLPNINESIAEGDTVEVAFNPYGDPIDVRHLTKANINSQQSQAQSSNLNETEMSVSTTAKR
ncbi:hypothetical protein [Shewanella waksmanii]|uniref:hypothetical protein n=1 Tax=Shewanella waksmanii TaxID=213783 RepID=UPI003736EED2